MSENYCSELRNLVKMMLIKDDMKRPNINQILKYKFVEQHMQKYLTTTVQLNHELKDKLLVIEADNNSILEKGLNSSLNLTQKKEKEEEMKLLIEVKKQNKPKLRVKLQKINMNIKSDLKLLLIYTERKF